jgi:hypothetical protein
MFWGNIMKISISILMEVKYLNSLALKMESITHIEVEVKVFEK